MNDGSRWPVSGEGSSISLTLYGRPYTKKNSPRIVKNKKTGARFVKPSENYEAYEKNCLAQIPHCMRLFIEEPVNVKCLYWMPTRHRVDLVNLLEATDDILVNAGVLKDDNAHIIVSHDGSRVKFSKENPRVEIVITRAAEKGAQTAEDCDRPVLRAITDLHTYTT